MESEIDVSGEERGPPLLHCLSAPKRGRTPVDKRGAPQLVSWPGIGNGSTNGLTDIPQDVDSRAEVLQLARQLGAPPPT